MKSHFPAIKGYLQQKTPRHNVHKNNFSNRCHSILAMSYVDMMFTVSHVFGIQQESIEKGAESVYYLVCL